MIYFCADDYGLDDISSAHIKQCIDEGVLNKVSVFPNFDSVDLGKISTNKDVRISLHLNLVEGKCMSYSGEIDLIADEGGTFKHTFEGLLMQNILHRNKFEKQIYKEIRAQVLYWKSILPENTPFCIDSHQHTHMIPGVFSAMLKVLNDENINVGYIRIPAEPILPYIKVPSLYFTYRPINLIKQWLLKFLWLINRKHTNKQNIPTSHFFGILFSGKMDGKRVNKVLDEYKKIAEKDGRDIEVLFHPGYIDKSDIDLKSKHIVFDEFYLSQNRKTEFNSVMKINKKEVNVNAIHRAR